MRCSNKGLAMLSFCKYLGDTETQTDDDTLKSRSHRLHDVMRHDAMHKETGQRSPLSASSSKYSYSKHGLQQAFFKASLLRYVRSASRKFQPDQTVRLPFCHGHACVLGSCGSASSSESVINWLGSSASTWSNMRSVLLCVCVCEFAKKE